ncbi:MAG: 1-(5-phosphoribosyl)-5-amino-4-imidazole-carboxyl ate carboxylase [Melioribacteraceae bacterium]|nr:MAG: 1-(5-phosphoribosyl)-5-amino-4-imidazole-carboxyl ate carboxylase [Melioribacteraceae bacterium]
MISSEKIEAIKNIIENSGITRDELVAALNSDKYADLSHTLLDISRQARNGQPEVVFGENKTAKQICEIISAMRENEIPVLVTRVSEEKLEEIIKNIPDAVYCEISRTITIKDDEAIPDNKAKGNVKIVTAGTSDLNVAIEAQKTLQIMGFKSDIINDVGVAGIHRLFARLEEIKKADVIIVIAGMEGALASVIAGLVSQPVIAVPTSVGYGANFNGISALLGMLTSCSGGITVVNINNGFGAASAAIRILNKIKHNGDIK